MIWNRDGIIWYSEDEVESYKQSEQEGLEIVAELKHENKKLIEALGIANKYTNKYLTTLQEIKAIAIHEIKELTDSAINGGRYLEILDIITKAEEK